MFKSNDGYFNIYKGDCLKKLDKFHNIDMIFADPPYFLSSGGTTCKNGQRATVNKGKWDLSRSTKQINDFNRAWIEKCKDVLSPNGTIWVSGTFHNIYSVGNILQELGFKILNNITWQKINPPPNLACKTFTHSTETIIWAAIDKKYTFNYSVMKKDNNNKQMKDVWIIPRPAKKEKLYGKHPTQKPEKLLEMIIKASTNEGDTMLDPFCGSGTALVVGSKMKRKCIGIEQDEEFYKLAIKRYKGNNNGNK